MKEKFEFPKVLLVAPQHYSKNYCFNEWADRVNSLTYPNYEVFLSDNSGQVDNTEIIKSKGFGCGTVPINKLGIEFTIRDSHNQCREKFLEGDYDYMFHLETDVFPPLDVIERMLSKKVNIIAGLYDIFNGKKRKAMVQVDETFDRSIRGYRVIKYWESEEPIHIDGKVKKVFHAGLGCILIHRSILEKIEFRAEENCDLHPDTHFANDCFERNIPIYLDTQIQCKHLNNRIEKVVK